MTFEDLINLYEDKKKIYKDNTYKYISEILKEAKEKHKQNHGELLKVKILRK